MEHQGKNSERKDLLYFNVGIRRRTGSSVRAACQRRGKPCVETNKQLPTVHAQHCPCAPNIAVGNQVSVSYLFPSNRFYAWLQQIRSMEVISLLTPFLHLRTFTNLVQSSWEIYTFSEIIWFLQPFHWRWKAIHPTWDSSGNSDLWLILAFDILDLWAWGELLRNRGASSRIIHRI